MKVLPYLVFLLFFTSVFYTCTAVVDTTKLESDIYRITNKERSKISILNLKYDSRLAEIARSYSRKMAERQFFDHYDPDGNDVAQRIHMGYPELLYASIGENIAFRSGKLNEDLAVDFMDGWMNSQGHRENILNPDFNYIGIGVYEKSNSIFATQVFSNSFIRLISFSKTPVKVNSVMEFEGELLSDIPIKNLEAVIIYPENDEYKYTENNPFQQVVGIPVEIKSNNRFIVKVGFDRGLGVYQLSFGKNQSYYMEKGFSIKVEK